MSNYDKAMELAKSGARLDLVYELLCKASSHNDPRADYAIGTWLLHGHYLRKNVRKGIRLIRHASKNGVAPAAFDMAVSYEKGIGVQQNLAIAAAYYLRAFRLGEDSAIPELERIFYWGIGVKANRRLAREFSLMKTCKES